MAGGTIPMGGNDGYFPSGEYRIRIQSIARPEHAAHGIIDSNWSEWFDFTK